MAVRITQACVGCYACKNVCPEKAIFKDGTGFVVASHRCNECAGHYEDLQCASICPIETAIVDETGAAFNPPGSLTGIFKETTVVPLNSDI